MTTPALDPDAVPPPDQGPDPDRGMRREGLTALAIAVGLAALGVPLGLLWRAVAPKVEFVMTDSGPATVQADPEGFVADDGWYVFTTLVVGVLAAAAVWTLIRRRRGPLMMLGLVAGCVAGGVLTSWVGHQIGYAHYRDLIAHAPVGTHIFRPPAVRSGQVGLWFGFLPRVQGAVLVQAAAAATTYLVLAAFHVEPDLRPPDDFEAWAHPAADTGTAPQAPDGAAAGEAVSWGPTGWTAPPGSPAPPGPGPAAPPRD